MKAFGTIYMIENLANGKVYIGQTTQPSGRYRHAGDLTRRGPNAHFRNAFKKYGKDSFEVRDLCACFDRDELNLRETYFIELFHSTDRSVGYNKKTGGQDEVTYSPEVRRVLSEQKRGEKNPQYGIPRSREFKRRMSALVKGEGNPFFGKQHSRENKDKIASGKGVEPFLVFKDGEVIGEWSCQATCAEDLSIIRKCVSACLNRPGRYKSHRGYVFKFKREVNP